MNRLSLQFVLSLLLLVGPIAAQGQTELDRVYDKLKSVVEDAEPGWKCKRTDPFTSPVNSPNLLLVSCSLQSQAPLTRRTTHTVVVRHVSFKIAPHESAAEARRLLHIFVGEHANEVREISDLRDEAYGWGMDKADIVLVKGRFTLFIDSDAHVEFDADAKTLTREQKDERERAERGKLSHKFAQYFLAAADSF